MDRPHLQWPIRFSPDGEGFQMVEQDSDQDLAGCMATGLLWPLGTRDLDPEFGNLDALGNSGGMNLEAAKHAASYADERAGDLNLLENPDELARFVSDVQVGFAGTGPA